MTTRDSLLKKCDAGRFQSVIDLVKKFYQVDGFHEDVFFRLLLSMDAPLREEGRRHGIDVDLDAVYVQLYKDFLSGGPLQNQPLTEISSIPLPVQRRLAYRGYFLNHFCCHPMDKIAMECLPHLIKRVSFPEIVGLPAINSKLLRRLAEDHHLFTRDDMRYALVANPKTPGNFVMNHTHFLKSHHLNRLADSKDCNQMSRVMASRLISRKR